MLIYSFIFDISFLDMYRLGSTCSRPSEWEKSCAFYSRLTLSPSTGISRPLRDYPQPLTVIVSNPQDPAQCIRMFRTELLDLGHTNTYFDLCKSITSDRPYITSIL